jgi:hypothetical protein
VVAVDEDDVGVLLPLDVLVALDRDEELPRLRAGLTGGRARRQRRRRGERGGGDGCDAVPVFMAGR